MESGSAPPDRPEPERASPRAPWQPPSYPTAPGAEVPEGAPRYGEPAPPGGWQQPIARHGPGWVGRPLAGWWSRVGATLLDGLILLVPVVVLVAIVVAVVAAEATSEAL